MNINLSEITLDNIGDWPSVVKAGMLAALGVVLLSLGFWFDTQEQIDVLNRAKEQELQLRAEFETKQNQAINLVAYRAQLQEMKRSFGVMLRQLPLSTEVPGLLEDVSKTGVATGLEFTLFKPLPEQQKDFYAELPIQITVVGSYHQLAQFVSKVAALNRIVTLHDFTIESPGVSAKAKNLQRSAASGKDISTELLVMDVTAMTYRYLEEQPAKSKSMQKKTKSES